MSARLTGRTAIVTGASRGLGRATAVALAAEGAGRTVGHLQVLDGSFEPFTDIEQAMA